MKQWLHHCFNICLAAVLGLYHTFQTTCLLGKTSTITWSLPEFKVINKKLYIHYTDRAGCGSQVFIDISKKKQEHSDYKGLLHTFGQEVDSRPFCHRARYMDFWVYDAQWFHSEGLSATILKTQNFNAPWMCSTENTTLRREISFGCFTKVRHYQIMQWVSHLK